MSKTQEEISIQELMNLFIKLWEKMIRLFLLGVLFVIKHAIPLVLLLGIGIGIAYYHNNANPRYKQDFVISSTEYSGEFLFQKIDEINLKFQNNNLALKKELSLDELDLRGVKFSVKPIYAKGTDINNSEYQYLKYITENKIISKKSLERMMQMSNLSYSIRLVYPEGVDGLRIFNATLEYLRSDAYASEIHQAVLMDIDIQIQENRKIIFALGDYVSSLGDAGTQLALHTDAVMIEGSRGSDLGSMLGAREQTQKKTSKLIVKKVQLSENFRLLIESNPSRYYGKGIVKNRILTYPVALMFGYVFLVFVVSMIRKALVLKAEMKKELPT